MKLSVCIDSVFGGVDPCEAAARVKSMGIDAIEFWGWWNKDLDQLKAVLDENEMTVAAFCNQFISLVDPAEHATYMEELQGSIAAAKKLGCKTIITQTGADRGIDREEQKRCLIQGLKRCAQYLEGTDICLAVEPLNTRVDHKGYFLTSSDECMEILAEVGSKHVKMLYDIYHQQISEGDLISHINQYYKDIVHFHTAGVPGRHELYRSEIDYRQVLTAVEKTGYDGYVGLEYMPADEWEKGLRFAGELQTSI